jgi:hypothetical protein
MPGQIRLDAPGVLHHVMVRGIEKRPIVDDAKDRGGFFPPGEWSQLKGE